MENLNEIWKDILGYEGLYQVSNLGRVKSLARIENGHYRNGKYNVGYYRKEKILKQRIENIRGKKYYVVHLYINNKVKAARVHRLVAIAFIPNPNNFPYIDHIDTNGLNNVWTNLRWVTQKMNCSNKLTKLNMKYAQRLINGRAICCYKDDILIKEFDSIASAVEYFNFKSKSAIDNCLAGKTKTAYGYKWQYAVIN